MGDRSKFDPIGMVFTGQKCLETRIKPCALVSMVFSGERKCETRMNKGLAGSQKGRPFQICEERRRNGDSAESPVIVCVPMPPVRGIERKRNGNENGNKNWLKKYRTDRCEILGVFLV